MRSPLRSLFAKIFVWFWLALALLVAVMWMVGQTLGREPRSAGPGRGGPFGTVFQSASDLMEIGGRDAVQRLLAGLEGRENMRTWLLDGPREVRGRDVPADVARAAEAALRFGGRSELPTRSGMLFAAELGPAGANGLVLVMRPRPMPRPLGIFLPFSFGGPWAPALLVAVAGIVCLVFVLWLVTPVRRLREATRRLAAGDLGARTGYGARPAGDELEALARDFDDMAARIESLVGAQRQLLSDISHELRSPLARMSVAIGLARTRTGPEGQPMLDRIERESERLNDLIGQLLQLSRLESRGVPVLLETLDLAELLEGLVEDARFEAQAGHREVALDAAGPLAIEGHRELLRSAIENVLRNALRYTPEYGRVEVCLATDGDAAALVRVRDHGPGVPEDQLEAIFRPFHRVEAARERGTGGTGLGLAIARRAVEAHGGTIAAHTADGGGLEIALRLPRHAFGAARA